MSELEIFAHSDPRYLVTSITATVSTFSSVISGFFLVHASPNWCVYILGFLFSSKQAKGRGWMAKMVQFVHDPYSSAEVYQI